MRRILEQTALLLAAALAAGCAGSVLGDAEMTPRQRGILFKLRRQAGETRTAITAAEKRLGALTSQIAASAEAARTLAGDLRSAGIRVSPRGASIVVEIAARVLFSPGEAELGPGARKELARIARVLNGRFPARRVRVEGHTDSSAPKKVAERFPTNWELSAARAVAVVRFLVGEGEVAPERVSAAAYADIRPVAENDSLEGRTANRRVEIVLLPPIQTARVSAKID